jgi:hypothetical protein
MILFNDATTYAFYTICYVLCRIPYSYTDKPFEIDGYNCTLIKQQH